MATTIECEEHFPYYSPDQVFAVGTLFDALPEGHSFSLKRENEEDVRFAEGVKVHLGLVAIGITAAVDGMVTEFEEGKHIKIEGSAHLLGTAAVWFDLGPDEEQGGTAVDYGLKISPIAPAKLFVARKIMPQLKKQLPRYTEHYKQNVMNMLDERHGRLSA